MPPRQRFVSTLGSVQGTASVIEPNRTRMNRTLLLLAAFAITAIVRAQTYFYINEIAVNPQPATEADNISIDLIGGLSSTGASVLSASADVVGSIVTISITAIDVGGLAVIVPHTETLQLNQLPAGTYTIAINGVNVADLAPSPQHLFTVMPGASVCDSLEIVSVQWHAFTDTAIVVHVINENANEIFDYPNFILFDGNGDTLAVETVNFFGIGGESWHVLNLHPDATVPVDPFYGTLQLWTLFTEELACEWMPFIDLCPPAPCTTIIPNVQNLGGALAIGDYNYALMDADMNSVASGTLTMTSDMQFDADTLCLPPGDYWMACYAAQPPTGGAPWFGVMTPGWIAGPQHPVSFDLPVITPFSFYESCIDGTNGIAEAIGAPLSILRMGDALRIQRADGAPLGMVELFDAQGRLIGSVQGSGSTVDFDVAGASSGVLVVRAGGQSVRCVIMN